MSELQEKIKEYLKGKGFTSNDDEVFTLECEIEQQGARIVMNGQMMIAPPTKIPIKSSIILMGTGNIDEELIEVIKIEIQNEQESMVYTQALYDFEEFMDLFEKIQF